MRAFAAGLVAALVFAAGPIVTAQSTGQQQEKPKESTAATDALSGDWDGTVVLPDGAMPFSMKLKLEKDKVTGDIGSVDGAIPITGTFADGKLAFAFVYVNGEAVSATGDLKDGQLSGQMDVNGGQFLLTWTAQKKKA